MNPGDKILMKQDIYVKLSSWIAIAAIVICALTAGYSYHAYNLSRNIQRAHQKSLDTLHQEITRLEAKLTELGSELAVARGQTRGTTGDLKSPENKFSTSRSTVLQLQTLEQMEQILDSTGLAQLAENENVDPSILLQMYDEYAQRNQVASYRQKLLQKDREDLDADSKNYEEELMSLYELARHRRGSDTDRETREKAFEEMVEKYPDAYATAKVIAERAVWSAFRGNTTVVEEYYQMLRQNDKFATVTTDRGLEVLPNIAHYLAQQYLRDGRMEDARGLRDSLDLNYSDSYILTREPGIGWKWLPVSQVVSKLDQQIK